MIAFGLFCLLFVYAYTLEAAYTPPQDMVAPFAQTAGKPVIAGSNKTGLEIQNLSARDIEQKIEIIVPEALSFNRSNFSGGTTLVQKYFTAGGYQQYKQFMQAAGLETAIQQNFQTSVFLDAPPLEISSGVFGGAYKWLFEVPITLNFIPKDIQSYRGGETAQARKALLRIQFTRVLDQADPDAVKIEIWQAGAPRS